MCPEDTSPEAWKVFLDVQRRMPPAEKIRLAFEWSTSIRRAAEAGLRNRYPDAPEREIFLHMARLILGEDLFAAVYGGAHGPTG